MDLSTFAVFLGIFEVLIGVPLIFAPRETFRWLMHVQDDHPELMRVVAFIFLVPATLVLFDNPAVTWDVAGVVRFFAWITAIKCLLLCWFPAAQAAIRRRFVSRDTLVRIMCPVPLAIGLFFLWVACEIG